MAKDEIKTTITITITGALDFPGLIDPDRGTKTATLALEGARVVGTELSVGRRPDAPRQSQRRAEQRVAVAIEATGAAITLADG